MHALLGGDRYFYILQVIADGYALSFKCQPQAYFKANHRGTRKEAYFVKQAIHNLLKSSCIKEMGRSELSVVSPLGVIDQGKKLRLT